MKNLLKIITQKILGKNQSNLLDLCIVGLGNPGDKYNHSRHNAGYDYLDFICNQLGVELKKSNKIEGLLGETTYKGLEIGFVKPNEFINNSGRTLSLIKKYCCLDKICFITNLTLIYQTFLGQEQKVVKKEI